MNIKHFDSISMARLASSLLLPSHLFLSASEYSSGRRIVRGEMEPVMQRSRIWRVRDTFGSLLEHEYPTLIRGL